MPAPFASPMPHGAVGEDPAVAMPVISLKVRAVGTEKNDVVRVGLAPHLPWASLLQRVQSRLLAAGSMPNHHVVVGLRAGDGAKVVSAEDIRDGEVLEPDTVPAREASACESLAPAALLEDVGPNDELAGAVPMPAVLFQSPAGAGSSDERSTSGSARKNEARKRKTAGAKPGARMDLTRE